MRLDSSTGTAHLQAGAAQATVVDCGRYRAMYTIDTHAAIGKLENTGLSASQAKAIVGTIAESFSDTVATKADIAELKADMLKVALGIVVTVIFANAGLTFAIVRFLLPP